MLILIVGKKMQQLFQSQIFPLPLFGFSLSAAFSSFGVKSPWLTCYVVCKYVLNGYLSFGHLGIRYLICYVRFNASFQMSNELFHQATKPMNNANGIAPWW